MARRLVIGLLMIGAFWSLGFRTYPGEMTWNINNSAPAATKLFVIYANPAGTLSNDLPEEEALSGGGDLTVQQLMNSVMDDYNSIDAAFVTLVDTSDSDYNLTIARQRTITIEFGSSSGASSGEARVESEDGTIVGCDITLDSEAQKGAMNFVRVVTHEIGHCLGLMHSQESTHAIMSYYSDNKIIRLQADDKMGVVYLYPQDESAAEESPTLGLGCSR